MHCHHPHHPHHPEHHHRRRQFWGLLLLTGGGLLLALQLQLLSWPAWAGKIDDYGIGHLLAAMLAIAGLSRLYTDRSRRGLLKAGARLAIAGWLFACLQGLFGLTFANSWPLLLILFGVGVLLCGRRPLLRVRVDGEQP